MLECQDWKRKYVIIQAMHIFSIKVTGTFILTSYPEILTKWMTLFSSARDFPLEGNICVDEYSSKAFFSTRTIPK